MSPDRGLSARWLKAIAFPFPAVLGQSSHTGGCRAPPLPWRLPSPLGNHLPHHSAFCGMGSSAVRNGALSSHIWVAKAGRRRHNIWSQSVDLNDAWVGRVSSDALGLSLNGADKPFGFKTCHQDCLLGKSHISAPVLCPAALCLLSGSLSFCALLVLRYLSARVVVSQPCLPTWHGGTPASYFRSSSGMPVSFIRVTNVFCRLLNGLEMPYLIEFAR